MEGRIAHTLDGVVSERAPGRTPVRNAYLKSWRKRCLDVAGALSIGLVLSPVIAVVVVAMAFQNGPIVFGHERIGHRGKRFCCYKFRSMIHDADRVLNELLERDPSARAEWERNFKLKSDPRVTRLGAFLRKTSLDELPQLWNVFKGEMSLVGPRPIVREELIRYGRGARFYLSTRPGLTGLWQVSGRSDIVYGRRIAMDRKYSERASLFVDFSIVAKTVLVVLKVKGAY